MLDIPKEVKNLFLADSITKNFRVHFPDGERDDLHSLTNENVESETVQLTESICSFENLKFGLSEVPVLEFEAIGVGNIKGYRIEAGIEIDITSLGEEFIAKYGQTSDDVPFSYYYIPYGVFTVDSCKREANTNKRQVVAYGINQKLELSPLEKLKVESRKISADSYKIDVDRFAYCNIENTDIEFEVEEYITADNKGEIADLDENFIQTIEEEDTVFLDNGYYDIKRKYIVINFGRVGSLAYFYKLDYQKSENYSSKIKEISELIELINQEKKEGESGIYKNYLTGGILDEFYVQVSCVYPAMTLNYVGNEYYFTEDTVVNFNTNYLLTGYVGFDEEQKITITLPVSFSYKKVGSGESSSAKEYTDIILADSVGVSRLSKPITAFCNISMQLEREQMLSGKYRLKEGVVEEILKAYAEIRGSFICSDRNGATTLRSIQNNFGLYPSEDLYPAEYLYPNEASDIVPTYSYKSLLYEEYKTKEIDCVNMYYYLDGEKHTFPVGQTFNNMYSLLENYILSKVELEYWQMIEIGGIFLESVKGISYIPVELEMRGLPYIEVGDVLNVLTIDGGLETFVFRRTLTGIQKLTDDVEAQGDEIYGAYDDIEEEN